MTLVDDFLPVRVLALQHVFETDLLRRRQAQRRELDPHVADVGGQAHPLLELVWLAVGFDLLDMDRRREFVDSKMTGIDHLDAFSRHEPQFAIGGLRDGRTELAGAVERSRTPSAASQTVVSILRFGSAIHASSSVRAMRTRPQAVYNHKRTVVVLYRPVNRVAGQTIPAS